MEGFREFITEKKSTHSEGDVVFLYLQKAKITEIATQTGRSIGEIYRILKRNHISPNRLKTGHNHVLYYHDAGFDTSQIAGFTNYSERNVRYILRNKLTDAN